MELEDLDIFALMQRTINSRYSVSTETVRSLISSGVTNSKGKHLF